MFPLSAFFVALALGAHPQETPSDSALATLPLDARWHGHWKGTLELPQPGPDGRSSVAMELVVTPLADSTGLAWTMVYGEGESRQERRYALLPGDGPNRYVLDERNGILIDTVLQQGALVSAFTVQGMLLVSREELVGDALHFRIDTFSMATPRASGAGEGERRAEVASYRPVSSQRAVLRRDGSAR